VAGPDHHVVLRIEYDGTPYHGWSRQPGGLPTIEGDLIDAFAALECTHVQARCAGRTDAGVHATAQVVDVRYRGGVPVDRLARALSRHLRPECSVLAAIEAPVGFDARADATSRAYEYRVLERPTPSPLRARYVLHHPRRLDRDVLDAAAAAVVGQHRFTGFTPAKAQHAYFDRTIETSRWIERGDELVYQVRANSFLRHMVRVLVGSMLAAGRGECTLEEFVATIDGAPRDLAKTTAPAHGLCFVDVTWEPRSALPLPPGWRAGRVVPFSPAG